MSAPRLQFKKEGKEREKNKIGTKYTHFVFAHATHRLNAKAKVGVKYCYLLMAFWREGWMVGWLDGWIQRRA